MINSINSYLTKIQIGAEQSYKNLSIFPLLSDYFIPFAYRTMDESVSEDMTETLEILQKGSKPGYNVKTLQDYLEQFARVDSQIGALFVINGKVAGMDCFGKPDILEKVFMKILESYSRHAAGKFDPNLHLKSSKAEAIHFLQMAKGARVKTKRPVKLGTGCRLESKMCSGFALAHEDKVLRLSVVAKN